MTHEKKSIIFFVISCFLFLCASVYHQSWALRLFLFIRIFIFALTILSVIVVIYLHVVISNSFGNYISLITVNKKIIKGYFCWNK